MLTGSIRNDIDKLWEKFWTGGITNPLTIKKTLKNFYKKYRPVIVTGKFCFHIHIILIKNMIALKIQC